MLLVRAGLCGTHAGTSFCGWPGSSAAVAGRAATAWWSLEQGCFWGLGVRRAYGASAGRVAGRGAGPAQAGAVLQERDVRPAVRVGVDAEVVEQLAAARAVDSALAHGPAVDGHQPVRRTPARGGPGHVLRRNRRTRSGWPRWVRRSTRGLRSCWSRPATGKSLARCWYSRGAEHFHACHAGDPVDVSPSGRQLPTAGTYSALARGAPLELQLMRSLDQNPSSPASGGVVPDWAFDRTLWHPHAS